MSGQRLANVRRCGCGVELPLTARPTAKHCSTRCRVAAHRRSALFDLKARPRWVRWAHVARRGATTKLPITPTGATASSTDPETWSRYADVARSSRGAGVGFVLNGDGIICLDLDHCVTDGTLQGWAVDVVEAAGDTYSEFSPSGTGLHIWGRGHRPRGRIVTVPGGRVECYGTGRFITVTGNPIGPARRRLGDLSGLLAQLRP